MHSSCPVHLVEKSQEKGDAGSLLYAALPYNKDVLTAVPLKIMKKIKVLIIDDDSDFVDELTDMLRESGYEVVVDKNSLTAAKTAAKATPDIILLDLKMPGKSGFQVADELRQSSSTEQTPIIAITGFYSQKDELSLIDIYGIRKCISKPFNPEYLLESIVSIVGPQNSSIAG